LAPYAAASRIVERGCGINRSEGSLFGAGPPAAARAAGETATFDGLRASPRRRTLSENKAMGRRMMCQIFAGQDPRRYASETRSIRLHGHSTSIRLETAFWAQIDQIAADSGLTTPQFVAQLHDEVVELRGEVGNFASLLRCACLIHAGGDAATPVAA